MKVRRTKVQKDKFHPLFPTLPVSGLGAALNAVTQQALGTRIMSDTESCHGGIVWEARALTTLAALSVVTTGAEGGDRYTPPLLQMGTTGAISSVADRGPTRDRST